MTRKQKKDLNIVLKAVDDLETFKSYKAVAVALQKQLKELQETNKKLAQSNEDLSAMVEHLKDQVDSLESELEDSNGDEYQRGYDDGHLEARDSYDTGHSDGYEEGFREGVNSVEERQS